MKIIVVGLNHKTAPVELREKLAFGPAETIKALRLLKDRHGSAEFVLLSTCNRVELYCASTRTGGVDAEDLLGFLAGFHGLGLRPLADSAYIYADDQAVGHLLEVASSLDSMVVGEPQIINQVKQAYRLACTAKSTGKILNRLFHCAFAAGKKVHSTTAISCGRVSVAGFAVELAMQLFEDVASAAVVVVGAGRMGELLLKHLLGAGCTDITIVNRSYDRAVDQAERFGVRAAPWQQLPQLFQDAHIVVSSAGCEHYLFRKDQVVEVMSRRRRSALLIIDIAVPRNFDPAVNEIENVYLYSIDDLSSVVQENLQARQADIARAAHIIRASTADFMDWFRARDIGPLIGQMREKFAGITQQEMERFFAGSRVDASCRAVIEPMVKRIVNKLLHCIISNVNVVARQHGSAEAAKLVDSIVKQAEQIAAGPTDTKENQS